MATRSVSNLQAEVKSNCETPSDEANSDLVVNAKRLHVIKEAEVKYRYETPSDEANAVLIVEGKRLHVIKELLMISSPVFKAMFTGNFKEAKTKEVKLKGKKAAHLVWMLDFLYPDTDFTLTEDVAASLIPIADEYQLKRLTLRCTDFLMNMKHTKLNIIVLAQQYGFDDLERKAIEDCALNVPLSTSEDCDNDLPSLDEQEKLPENNNIPKDTLITIYKTKIYHVRSMIQDLETKLSPMRRGYFGNVREVKDIKDKLGKVQTGPILDIC